MLWHIFATLGRFGFDSCIIPHELPFAILRIKNLYFRQKLLPFLKIGILLQKGRMVNIIEVFHIIYFAGLKIDLFFHPPHANMRFTLNYTEIP